MEWTKHHRKSSNIRDDKSRVGVNKRGFTLSHGCHFTPKFVDLYTSPQGSGRGVKVAFVASETGEFKLHGHSKKIATDHRDIHCKEIVKDLNCIFGKYEARLEDINGAEGLVFVVDVKRTLG